MTVKPAKPKLSTRASERKVRIAEQSTREAEQSTRKAEQTTREAEQTTRMAEQSTRDSEHKTRLSEQIWIYISQTILLMLLVFVPMIGVGTIIIGRNLFINKTKEHIEMQKSIDRLNVEALNRLEELSTKIDYIHNGKKP